MFKPFRRVNTPVSLLMSSVPQLMKLRRIDYYAGTWKDNEGRTLIITGEQAKRPSSKIDQRDHVLDLIRMIREDITSMSDKQLAAVRIEGLPFWHIINGPISDALSHVGQINMARRLMGKPTPEANVFRCDPPS